MTITKQEKDLYEGLKLSDRLNLHFDLLWASMGEKDNTNSLNQWRAVDEACPDMDKATYKRIIRGFWDDMEEYISFGLQFNDLVLSIFQIEAVITGIIGGRSKERSKEYLELSLNRYDHLLEGVLEWRSRLGPEREARLWKYSDTPDLIGEALSGLEERVKYAKVARGLTDYPKGWCMEWGFILSVISNELMEVMFKDAREQALARLYA